MSTREIPARSQFVDCFLKFCYTIKTQKMFSEPLLMKKTFFYRNLRIFKFFLTSSYVNWTSLCKSHKDWQYADKSQTFKSSRSKSLFFVFTFFLTDTAGNIDCSKILTKRIFTFLPLHLVWTMTRAIYMVLWLFIPNFFKFIP